jgi:hypothetical protein
LKGVESARDLGQRAIELLGLTRPEADQTGCEPWLTWLYGQLHPERRIKGEVIAWHLPGGYFAAAALALERLGAVASNAGGTPVGQDEGGSADRDSGETEQAEGDADDEAAEDRLTNRQRDILETMLREEITSHRRRQIQANIVRLINRNHKPATYKTDFAALVRRGWLQSEYGPEGGMWLPHQHRAAIEQALSSS